MTCPDSHNYWIMEHPGSNSYQYDSCTRHSGLITVLSQNFPSQREVPCPRLCPLDKKYQVHPPCLNLGDIRELPRRSSEAAVAAVAETDFVLCPVLLPHFLRAPLHIPGQTPVHKTASQILFPGNQHKTSSKLVLLTFIINYLFKSSLLTLPP